MKTDRMDNLLDQALKTPVDYQLPGDFTDRVMRRIELKKAMTDRRVAWVQLAAGVAFALAALGLMLVLLPKGTAALDTLLWGALIGLLVVVFQVLDQRLVVRGE